MIVDPIILDNLRERPINDDTMLVALEAAMKGKRFLDKEPKQIGKDPKTGTPVLGGVGREYKAFYDTFYDSHLEKEMATLDLRKAGRGVVKCEYVVFNILKSLIYTGVSVIPELAEACRSVFMRILVINANPITRQSVLPTLLDEDDTYYMQELKTSILACSYTDKDLSDFWIQTMLSKVTIDTALIKTAKSVYAEQDLTTLKKNVNKEYKALTPEQKSKKKTVKFEDKFLCVMEARCGV